jgi:hypothetical protein
MPKNQINKQMIKTNFIKFIFMGIFAITACTNSIKNQKKDIEKTIKTLYSKELNYRTVDTSLISPTLISLFEKGKQKEMASAESIRNSDHPTDKPDIIEGDIFSSLYEGVTDVKIKDIVIADNQARVLVIFSNNHYKLTWEEELLMIKTTSWKLDNVIYNPKNYSGGAKDLQELMKNHIKTIL